MAALITRIQMQPFHGTIADDVSQALAGLTQDEQAPSAPSPTVDDVDAGGDAGDESGKKLSKAAKIRAKKAAAEADRERAIAEAKLNTRDYAAEETAAITAKLKPRGLKVVEVPSDGNCLYRSLLRQWSPCAALSTYQDVRSIIAGEMEEHATLYSAFVELEGDEDYNGFPPQTLFRFFLFNQMFAATSRP